MAEPNDDQGSGPGEGQADPHGDGRSDAHGDTRVRAHRDDQADGHRNSGRAGQHTLAEIMSQPHAWRAAARELEDHLAAMRDLGAAGFDQVIFTGCGSTYYLALAAAALTQQLAGVPARGVPASELWLYPDTVSRAGDRTLLVAVSRSGTTTETLRAVEGFRRKRNGAVATLTCYPDAELATLGDLNVSLTAGQEKSVAQTRAFSVLYLAATYLAHVLAGMQPTHLDALSDVCEGLLRAHEATAVRLGRDLAFDRFYFLGSGPRYGLACELSLKMKEMTLSHSEPFHTLEFRHGPQSMLTDATLMIGLLSEHSQQQERAVLLEAQQRGAQVLAVAPSEADVAFGTAIPDSLRNPLYLPVVQRLAFERALAKGLDPDRPHNLQAVVTID